MLKVDFAKGFALLGLGISGIAALEFLLTRKAKKIFVSDTTEYVKLPTKVLELLESNKDTIECEFGIPHSARCLEYDYLIVSPGLSPNTSILREARQRGLSVLTELDLAASQKSNYIGITGTNGKSTTTAWTAHILKAPACGNIGIPFLKAISDEPEANHYVCEMSSFQLEHSQSLHPKIAAFTNITPDHINWHGSWDNYLQAKFKITALQEANDWLIIPFTDPIKEVKTKAQILWIEAHPQSETNLQNSIWVNQQKQLFLRLNSSDLVICNVNQIPLPGQHNLENAMFAIAISALAGFSINSIKERLLSFHGLEHRIEFVREFNGKKFYNDSKATNPESSIVALQAFDEPIVWLAGGRDKLTDLKDLAEASIGYVSTLILFGEATERFERDLLANGFCGKLKKVADLNEAVSEAVHETGKIVLLSPACASFDQFSNFEERGNVFKTLVKALQ